MESKTFQFNFLPQNSEELLSLPEADLTTPFKTAALTLLSLNALCSNFDRGIQMLNALKGPQPLSPYETSFLRDRARGREHVPLSYFAGTSPENNYTPSQPYTVTVSDNPYSYQEDGYATLFIQSSGADSPRQVKLRRKGDQWFLWEQMLMVDIRTPKADDPWA